MPSFSFIATANAPATSARARSSPTSTPTTGNLTAETVEAALTPRTRAVIVVDQGGVPADLDAIRAAVRPARASSWSRTPPAAPARPYRGRPVGAGAEIAAWSFHPRKIITTGEGGMLTTADADWAERAAPAARARHERQRRRPARAACCRRAEEYLEVGFNYRMTDIQAAVGLVQLGRLDEIVARRRELAARLPARRSPTSPGLALRRRPRARARPTSSRSGSGAADDLPASTGTGCWRRWPTRASRPGAASWPPTSSPPTPTVAHGPLPVTERLTDTHADPAAVPPDDRASSRTGWSTR